MIRSCCLLLFQLSRFSEQMASECSHHDETRKGVSSTAHGVASLRGFESKRGKDALFVDPYADLMGGEVGRNFVNSPKFLSEQERPLGLIDGLAIRTRKIDDELMRSLKDLHIRQVCVLGAGLDTRPWRLESIAGEDVHYFEVDFHELFDYKLPLLQNAGAVSPFHYHSVVADLSLPEWPITLMNAGLDKNKPTVWILEGLINYLTPDEAVSMFSTINIQLAANGSRMIATCMTPRTKVVTSYHRFFPEDPLTWLNAQGWTGTQIEVEQLGVEYGRPVRDKCMDGYYIAVVDFI